MKNLKFFILGFCFIISLSLFFGCAASSGEDKPSDDKTTATAEPSGLGTEENNKNEESLEFGDITGGSETKEPADNSTESEDKPEKPSEKPTDSEGSDKETNQSSLEVNTENDKGSWGEWF